MKTVITLSICAAMTIGSNSKQRVSSGEEVINTSASVFCADSLVGKKLISLLPFELYDKPNGKIVGCYDYENGFFCIAGLIKEDWIRLDYVIANSNDPGKDLIVSYGWTQWHLGDTMVFRIIGEGFPLVSPYDENALYELPVYSPEYPQYPGGGEAIEQFLKKEVQKRYPPTARQMGIKGQVLVSFVVEKDGTMSGFGILHNVSDEIDKAAIECIKSLPERWTPAKTKLIFDTTDRTVRCKAMLAVTFR